MLHINNFKNVSKFYTTKMSRNITIGPGWDWGIYPNFSL